MQGFRAGEALLFQLNPHHERSGSRFPSFGFFGHGDWWEWEEIIRVFFFSIKSATVVQVDDLCFKHSKGFCWKFHAELLGWCLLPMIEGKKGFEKEEPSSYGRLSAWNSTQDAWERCLYQVQPHFSAACLVLHWSPKLQFWHVVVLELMYS